MASVAEVKANAQRGNEKLGEALGHLRAADEARKEAANLFGETLDGSAHEAVAAALGALTTMGTGIEEAQAAGMGATEQASTYMAGL